MGSLLVDDVSLTERNVEGLSVIYKFQLTHTFVTICRGFPERMFKICEILKTFAPLLSIVKCSVVSCL